MHAVAPGLVRDATEPNMWTLIKTRKATRCGACAFTIPKGQEAYRPLMENGMTQRGERLCCRCMRSMVFQASA